MKYTDVVKMMKQAAMEVANPKGSIPQKPTAKPDPNLVGTVKYKDPNTGKWVIEHPVRGASVTYQPKKVAPIKKPAPSASTINANIPLTFSTGPAAGMPYSRIKTQPFGNPLTRRPRIIRH